MVDVNTIPLFSFFLLLYHSVKTKISTTILTRKVKLIRKTIEGFLWSQKGKTTSEHEKKIMKIHYTSQGRKLQIVNKRSSSRT